MINTKCSIKSCSKEVKEGKITYFDQRNEELVFCSIECKEAMQKADSFK